jgi:hypothetical protein
MWEHYTPLGAYINLCLHVETTHYISTEYTRLLCLEAETLPYISSVYTSLYLHTEEHFAFQNNNKQYEILDFIFKVMVSMDIYNTHEFETEVWDKIGVQT